MGYSGSASPVMLDGTMHQYQKHHVQSKQQLSASMPHLQAAQRAMTPA